MKTSSSISRLVTVAWCGVAMMSLNTLTRAQSADDVETVPLIRSELVDHAGYLADVNARALPKTKIPTKIAATQTEPQFVQQGQAVALSGQLVWLDKSDRKKPVWRPLSGRRIEFQIKSKLVGVALTNKRGWATVVITAPPVTPPRLSSLQVYWGCLFQGDAKFKPSSPDGKARFVVTQ